MSAQAKLDAFTEAIDNIRSRRGVVVFCNASSYQVAKSTIVAVDDTANTVDVDKDVSTLSAGDVVAIVEAPTDPNTGTYTLASAPTWDSTNGVSTVELVESLGGATVEGSLVEPSFTLYTAGIIKDTNFGGEKVEFGPDNMGRTFVKGFDITGAFTAMQTGPKELQNLPAIAAPSGNGLYMAFVDNPFPIADEATGIQFSDIATQDKIELLNASVSPDFDLNFSREESEIPAEVNGYIPVSELTKIYSEPIAMG